MNEDRNSPKTLIVGAGLAGICLARRLHEKGFDFRIIDSGINSSSSVAAGIINPLVFRRMTKSWRIDEFLPVCEAFYGQLTEEWGNQYFHRIPIRRAFAHQQETDLWILKQETEAFQPYMKMLDESDIANQSVNNICGTGKVLASGFVQTHVFLEDAKKWLKRENLLTEAVFEHDQLHPETGEYNGEIYSEIVFCEGYRGIYNPWFSWLPLQTTKGEILTVASNDLAENELLNRKCFILPLGDRQFKIGATYSWRTPDSVPTDEAKAQLLSAASSLVDARFEVVRHEAGVRPTTFDRRPLMGSHPEFPKLKIFNGLGTKGYMLAPLLSQEFVAYLKDGIPLGQEIDINRCEKLHTKT